MLTIGDIHIYVHDFEAALRFWTEGIGLKIIDHRPDAAEAYAVLESQDAGAAIHLFGGAAAGSDDDLRELGERPGVSFDILTTDFDDTLVRLLECGGRQIGEIEAYSDMRTVTVADTGGNVFELMEVPDSAPDG